MSSHLRPLMVVLAGAVLSPALAPAAGAQQQVRVITRDSVRTEPQRLTMIRTSNPEDLLRLVQDLGAREERLLRELKATPTSDVARHDRIYGELSDVARERFAVLSAVEMRCEAESGPRPTGYLGLNLNTERDPVDGSPALTVVASVDPGSPAQRAGVLAGDTLLSLGGRDMRRRLPDAGLLEPGNRVSVRVARGGGVRDIMVTAAPRPQGIGRSCGEFERVLRPLRVAAPGRYILRDDQRAPQRREVGGGQPVPSAQPEGIRLFVFEAEHMASVAPFFAGAQFRALNDQWRANLRLKADQQGVLVNSVAAGSPMAHSGLREGDVVTALDDTPTAAPMSLVNLLTVNEKPEASLKVLRAGERKTLVLRLPRRP